MHASVEHIDAGYKGEDLRIRAPHMALAVDAHLHVRISLEHVLVVSHVLHKFFLQSCEAVLVELPQRLFQLREFFRVLISQEQRLFHHICQRHVAVSVDRRVMPAVQAVSALQVQRAGRTAFRCRRRNRPVSFRREGTGFRGPLRLCRFGLSGRRAARRGRPHIGFRLA